MQRPPAGQNLVEPRPAGTPGGPSAVTRRCRCTRRRPGLIGWMITSPGDLSCCGIRRYFLGTGHAAVHHLHGAVAAPVDERDRTLQTPRRWRSPVTDTGARPQPWATANHA